MRQLLIIKTGDKPHSLSKVNGDYEHWIAAGMGLWHDQVKVVDVRVNAVFPDWETIAGVAITGSDSMVTDHVPWMLQTAEWLRQAVAHAVPILGICFGHQLLAQALGGQVAYNPKGLEVGTTTVTLTEQASMDPLFKGLPSRFPAQVSHRQSVIVLPATAARLASSEMDPHQAFLYAKNTWGLQFHPEFDERIIRHFVVLRRALLEEEGKDPEALLDDCTPSFEAHSLLRRFRSMLF